MTEFSTNLDYIDTASFIVGYPRSGTTLMVALIDNHPDLLAFPEECYFLKLLTTPIIKDTELLNLVLKESVLARLQGDIPSFDREVNDRRNYNSFDYQHFKKKANKYFQLWRVSQGKQSTLQVLGLCALIKGYEVAVGKSAYSRWLIKIPLYERYWRQIFTDFPKAKIICMLRDPREAILSRTIKYSVKLQNSKKNAAPKLVAAVRNFQPPIRFLKEWKESISAARRIRESHPEQILLIRYENLVTNTVDTMQQVADFLNIKWAENLIQPSLNGNPWKGNSSHHRKFDNVTHPQQKNLHKFAPHQLWQIEAWIGDNMFKEPAEYKQSGVLNHVNLKAITTRLPGESLGKFIRNRSQMLSNMRRIMVNQGIHDHDSAA